MAFNLEELPQVLITFGVAVIFGAVIAIVLSSFQDSLITSATNTNESKTITVGTISDLLGGYNGWSLTEVRNATAIVLNTGEFELVGGAINITNNTPSAVAVLNESYTGLTVGTAFGADQGGDLTTIDEVYNESGIILQTTEYEITGNLINITNNTDGGSGNRSLETAFFINYTFSPNNRSLETSFFVDYSYSAADERYNISANGLQGVINISTYFSTSGTLIGVGILITIVIAAFAFGRFKKS